MAKTVFLFKNNDIDDLVEKIQIMEDDEKVRRMGQNAYEKFWSSSESMEEYLARHLHVYEALLTKKQS